MSEQPQNQAEELLRQILEELRITKADNQNMHTELEAIKKTVGEDIPNTLKDFAAAVEKGFQTRDSMIQEIKQAPTALQQSSGGGGFSKIAEQIGNFLEKAMSNPVAGAVDPNASQMELVKTLDKIQLMYAKKFLQDTAKSFGVPEAVETAQHITVSP
jgi:hypothetical protein